MGQLGRGRLMDIQRPLPKDTAALIDADPRLQGCQNLGLILDRLNPWEPNGHGWDLAFVVEERRQGTWAEDAKTGGEAKGLWLSNRRDDQRTRLIDTPLLRNQRIDPTLLARHHARWEQLAADFGADQASGLRFSMTAESRLVVGLG